MDLNIFIIFTLFAGAHSLKCYGCRDMGCHETIERTCSPGEICASSTAIQYNHELSEMEGPQRFRGCNSPENCINGSINFGTVKSALSAQCCKTDLCNSRDFPDYSFNHPNGKQCYYCDGKSCLNKLNCVDTEDYCITVEIVNTTSRVKVIGGCVSKYACDAASKSGPLEVISCCQGNLCNSAKSNNHSLIILSWSFIYYIIMFQLHTLQ